MNGSIEILIDSTIMEAYRVGDKDAMRLMYRAIDGDISIGICSYSVALLWANPEFDRKSEIGFTGLLGFLKVVDFDIKIAQLAGHLLREAHSTGEETYLEKTMENAIVEAIADSLDCPVATTSDSIDGFSNIEYVRIDTVGI
ncbi:MAG: hypothetical protein QF530_06105 [SAR202 cluster bacterium]|nr:hypothetical protein [SAR202 cluster bacterium]